VRAAMEGVDGCFHLAAIASVERSCLDWSGTHEVNLHGFINVLEAAAEANRRRYVPVVYASSAAVYGDPASAPVDESCRPAPITAYAADKLACELHARVGALVHRIPSVGLRFFNVYGPRQDPSSPYSGVISIFADRLRRRREVTIFGDGQQTRDFVFVGDVVAALTAAMERASLEPHVFNVCTGRPTSVQALVETLSTILGVKPAIAHRSARPGDIRTSVGDPSRLLRHLSVSARVALADGLRQTLTWMDEAEPAHP